VRTNLTLSKTVATVNGRRPGKAGAACGSESLEALRARGVLVLTKAQVAVALQVTYRTVTAMMQRGEIRCFRIGGRHVRIRIEEAIRQMEAREEAAA
jgi:excisionase family DNA binding protein